jgi:hypothetical protein
MPGMCVKYIGQQIIVEKNTFITSERSILGTVNISTDLDATRSSTTAEQHISKQVFKCKKYGLFEFLHVHSSSVCLGGQRNIPIALSQHT